MPRSPEPIRVLIADGYADAADSLGLLLTLWGYEACVAYSGPEALLLAERFRPKVALLELRLDGLHGFELASRLRAELGAGLHVAAVTGQGDAASRARARECGFCAHLVKPVEPESLRRLLGRLVGAAAVRHDAAAGDSGPGH